MWVIRFIGSDGAGNNALIEVSVELLGKTAADGLDISKMMESEFRHYRMKTWVPVALVKVEA